MRSASILGIGDGLSPRQSVTVVAERADRRSIRFEAIARLDGPIEVDYYRGGGILPAVVRRLKRESQPVLSRRRPGIGLTRMNLRGTGGSFAEEEYRVWLV